MHSIKTSAWIEFSFHTWRVNVEVLGLVCANANETTLHQSPNDEDFNNFRSTAFKNEQNKYCKVSYERPQSNDCKIIQMGKLKVGVSTLYQNGYFTKISKAVVRNSLQIVCFAWLRKIDLVPSDTITWHFSKLVLSFLYIDCHKPIWLFFKTTNALSIENSGIHV